MHVQVLMYRQDDPKKCTAAKLVRLGLAKSVKKTGRRTLILDPFAERTVLRADRRLVGSITGIDCSWTRTGETFSAGFSGVPRRLPPLFAGNPVNYSKLNKLTTVEAISAALFILGYPDSASGLLAKFKWGHTFYDLNRNLLGDYAGIKTESEIDPLLEEYNIRL